MANAHSAARMEAVLQREYHGRFIIELLQNARDAWIPRRALEGGAMPCVVRIRLTDDLLAIGNTGNAIDASTLPYKLRKAGESTKVVGEGSGHKGLGFRSVAEITDCTALHSRNDGMGPFTLSVKFHRAAGETLIASVSGEAWGTWARELWPDRPDPRSHRFPVFDFPTWCDQSWIDLDEFATCGGRGYLGFGIKQEPDPSSRGHRPLGPRRELGQRCNSQVPLEPGATPGLRPAYARSSRSFERRIVDRPH